MIHPKYFHTKKILRFILLGLRYVLPKDKILYFHERLLKSNYPNHTKHYSQGGQDLFVDMLLKAKTGGTFIEIGANDGNLYSNTLFFERKRNWTGVCVEPNPIQFNKLVTNRNAFCIQACAGSSNGVISFPVISDEEVSLLGRANGISSEGMIDVQQIDLPQLYKMADVSRVDFMSIDTEGSEHEILTSLNRVENPPTVIAVEENISHDLLDKQMKELGYDIVAKVYTDRIYVRRF
jgi:FkbM family methyltransferase